MKAEQLNERRPIFIQAMWRTGSTYVWKKFRDQCQYRAFYEPLHESLILPREEVEAVSSPEIRAALRHVPVDDFYFAEFPFMPGGGVEYFKKPMSYERYCLEPAEEDEELRRYIVNLIDYAHQNGQQPVFQFNRAMLRAGWLAQVFGGVQILALRNPRDVWKSFNSFDGNPFETRICAILGQNREKTPLKDLRKWIDFPRAIADSFVDECNTYTPFAADKRELLYASFFDFYIVCILQCAQYADYILDLDGISRDAAIREAANDTLRELGINISLDDCRLPAYAQRDDDEEWNLYEHFSIEMLKLRLPPSILLSEERLQKFSHTLSPHFRQILSELTPATARMKEAAGADVERKEKHELAIQLFECGDYQIAAHLLGDLLAERETGELWNDWATAQKAGGRLRLAELGFRQALRAEHAGCDAGASLGVLLFECGKIREALPLLQEAELSTTGDARPMLSHLVNAARKELGFMSAP